MTALSVPRDPAAEATLRLTQCQKLRQLFADRGGVWTNVALGRLTQRFGARILELRRGDDGGPPLDIQKRRMTATSSIWEYWCLGELETPAEPRASSLVAQLRAELALYRADYALRGLTPPRRGYAGTVYGPVPA